MFSWFNHVPCTKSYQIKWYSTDFWMQFRNFVLVLIFINLQTPNSCVVEKVRLTKLCFQREVLFSKNRICCFSGKNWEKNSWGSLSCDRCRESELSEVYKIQTERSLGSVMADGCASNGLRPLRNPRAFISFKTFGGQSVLDFQAFFFHSSFAPPLKVPAH